MSKLRTDYHELAAQLIRKELAELQISERTAAKAIGIPNSTFNAFLNLEYRKAQTKTVEKLMKCPVWSEETLQSLTHLRDYDANTFSHVNDNTVPKVRPAA